MKNSLSCTFTHTFGIYVTGEYKKIGHFIWNFTGYGTIWGELASYNIEGFFKSICYFSIYSSIFMIFSKVA